MNAPTVDGLVLTQPELLALLNATNPSTLFGIDLDTLIPADPQVHRDLMEAGIESLVNRNLLAIQDERIMMSQELSVLLRVISFPVIATVAVKETPGLGSQSLVYYHAGEVLVEHTMPDAEHYRFAMVPSVDVQMERIVSLLPLSTGTTPTFDEIVIPQASFFEARERVNAGDVEGARALLAEDVPATTADALVDAMNDPQFSGTVALLRVQDGEAADARNVAILQGQEAGWLFEQVDPGSELLRASRVGEGEELARLIGCWEELASPQPA